MKVEFSRATTAAVLAVSLAGPALSQDDFLRNAAPPATPAARTHA